MTASHHFPVGPFLLRSFVDPTAYKYLARSSGFTAFLVYCAILLGCAAGLGTFFQKEGVRQALQLLPKMEARDLTFHQGILSVDGPLPYVIYEAAGWLVAFDPEKSLADTVKEYQNAILVDTTGMDYYLRLDPPSVMRQPFSPDFNGVILADQWTSIIRASGSILWMVFTALSLPILAALFSIVLLLTAILFESRVRAFDLTLSFASTLKMGVYGMLTPASIWILLGAEFPQLYLMTPVMYLLWMFHVVRNLADLPPSDDDDDDEW